MLVENNLEVGLDLGPLRLLMAGEPGLDGVQVQRVARGVALSGEVASVATAERAVRLAAASLPEEMLVENNLRVALDVAPLRALLAADPDFQGVQVQRLAARGRSQWRGGLPCGSRACSRSCLLPPSPRGCW